MHFSRSLGTERRHRINGHRATDRNPAGTQCDELQQCSDRCIRDRVVGVDVEKHFLEQAKRPARRAARAQSRSRPCARRPLIRAGRLSRESPPARRRPAADPFQRRDTRRGAAARIQGRLGDGARAGIPALPPESIRSVCLHGGTGGAPQRRWLSVLPPSMARGPG